MTRSKPGGVGQTMLEDEKDGMCPLIAETAEVLPRVSGPDGPGERVRPKAELQARARRLRLVLTDSDGVLTDGGVYCSDSGEALQRFSVRNGMGVERLRGAGVGTAIITRELSECVERRSAKLRLPHLFLGVRDKAAQLPAILAKTGPGIEALAYIGDDVNDLEIMTVIGERGLTAAPADAMPDLLATCHYRCSPRGGHGAFGDSAENCSRGV
jgi:3-deoxy-D-manno-octulosonate 8-phosphate phosphatase (KDO 8-P phosphatase)